MGVVVDVELDDLVTVAQGDDSMVALVEEDLKKSLIRRSSSGVMLPQFDHVRPSSFLFRNK